MPLNKEYANQLLDWYEPLLTERQQEILSLYYKEDFSLSEIAENLSVSRSAVSDQINRADKQLKEYEEKLSLVSRYDKRREVYEQYKNTDNEIVQELIEILINLE